MRVSSRVAVVSLSVAMLLPGSGLAASKAAKPYPTVTCVSAKQKAAAKYCAAAFAAWSRFERNQDAGKRDAALADAAGDLDAAWQRAERKSDDKGVDCRQTTATDSATAAFIDSAAGAFAALVTDGLDSGNPRQAKCGGRLVKAAAARCASILNAESRFVLGPGKKSVATLQQKLAHARAEAAEDFAKAFARIAGASCPTHATADAAGAGVDAIADRVVRDTTSSPQVTGSGFDVLPGTPVSYNGKQITPVCMNGSPYAFFAKRGTVNKLLFYFQGGGACWESLTCSLPACDTSVDPTSASDNPGLAHSGFFDLANPANPFRDWNIVFVSYCSCDIHFGDAAQDYPPHVEHRGYQNSRAVEKWAREHFVAPDEVFVTGSSAGAYGAWFNAPLLMDVWPAAHFDVLADAGNGVITQSFLDQNFPNWNFAANLPPSIPELKTVLTDGSGIPGYTKVVATRFPNANWAHYASAYDGSFGGQSSFYAIMLANNNPVAALSWWTATCQFNQKMRMQVMDTAAALTNYRYYIGTGARHTMWYSNKVYNDTSGGVPLLVDWIDAMQATLPGAPAPGWTNVECTDCGRLLPNEDVGVPSPLVPPFVQVGPNVEIQCPAP
jgi:pectinacetylesterase